VKRLRCRICGWVGNKTHAHLRADQLDDPPGLRDICYGDWELIP
jgi:hypothetical protein